MNNNYLHRFYKDVGCFNKGVKDSNLGKKTSVLGDQGKEDEQPSLFHSFIGTTKYDHKNGRESQIVPESELKTALGPFTDSSTPIERAITTRTAKARVNSMVSFDSKLGSVLWFMKCITIIPLFLNLKKIFSSRNSKNLQEKLFRGDNIKNKFITEVNEFNKKIIRDYTVKDGKICMKKAEPFINTFTTTQGVTYEIEETAIFIRDGNEKRKIFAPSDENSLVSFTHFLASFEDYVKSPEKFRQGQLNNLIVIPTAVLKGKISNNAADEIWIPEQAEKVKRLVELKEPNPNKDVFLFLHGSGDSQRKAKSSQLTFSHLHERLTAADKNYASRIVDGPSSQIGERTTRNIFTGLKASLEMINNKCKVNEDSIRLTILGHSRGGCESIVINNYLCILIKNNFDLVKMERTDPEYFKLLMKHCDQPEFHKLRYEINNLKGIYSNPEKNAEEHIEIRTMAIDPVTGPTSIPLMKHEGLKFVDEFLTTKHQKRLMPVCLVEHASKINKQIFNPVIPECLEHIDVIPLYTEHGHATRYTTDAENTENSNPPPRKNHGHINSYQMLCWTVGLEPNQEFIKEENIKNQKVFVPSQTELAAPNRKKIGKLLVKDFPYGVPFPNRGFF